MRMCEAAMFMASVVLGDEGFVAVVAQDGANRRVSKLYECFACLVAVVRRALRASLWKPRQD